MLRRKNASPALPGTSKPVNSIGALAWQTSEGRFRVFDSASHSVRLKKKRLMDACHEQSAC